MNTARGSPFVWSYSMDGRMMSDNMILVALPGEERATAFVQSARNDGDHVGGVTSRCRMTWRLERKTLRG